MLEQLFPKCVKTYSVNPLTVSEELYPQEAQLIQNAVLKRQREFTAGRIAAKHVLAELQITGFPLLIGTKREPVWPEQICGSISHTHDYCGVAAALTENVKSLGLDVEQVGKLKCEAWNLICNPDEIKWIDTLPEDERATYFTVIFSAKECVYKCQYPLTRQWIDFHAVSIHINKGNQSFRTVFHADTEPILANIQDIEGKFRINAGKIFSGIALPATKER